MSFDAGPLFFCCFRQLTEDDVERHRECMKASLVPLPKPHGWLINRAVQGAGFGLFVAGWGFYDAIKLVSKGSQDGHSPWDDTDVGTAIVCSFMGLTLLLLGSLFPPFIYASTRYLSGVFSSLPRPPGPGLQGQDSFRPDRYSYDRACHLLFFAGGFFLFAIYNASWNNHWRLAIYKFTILQAFAAYGVGWMCARALDVFEANAAAADAAAANAAPASTIEMGAPRESGTAASVV